MMENNHLILAMDGSGLALYSHSSEEFCVSCVIATKSDFEKIEKKLAKINKKYFNDSSVVLHYTQISRKIGVFDCLKDPKVENDFWCEVISLVNSKNIYLVYALVDKSKARVAGWQEKTIAERAYERSIISFFKQLINKKVQGKIVTESDIYSDQALISVHNTFQSKGIKGLKVNAKEYHKTITSLSLVNKYNLDAGVQIADLLGSIARLKYKLSHTPTSMCTKLDKKILRLLKRKIKNKEARLLVVI